MYLSYKCLKVLNGQNMCMLMLFTIAKYSLIEERFKKLYYILTMYGSEI